MNCSQLSFNGHLYIDVHTQSCIGLCLSMHSFKLTLSKTDTMLVSKESVLRKSNSRLEIYYLNHIFSVA